MKRVQEIKSKRERAFFKNRMSGNKEMDRQKDIHDIQQNLNLLPVSHKQLQQEVVKILQMGDKNQSEDMDTSN